MESPQLSEGPLGDGRQHIVRQVHTTFYGVGKHTTFVMTFCDDSQYPIQQEDLVQRLGIERTVKLWRPGNAPCKECALNAMRYVTDLMPLIERAHEPSYIYKDAP